MTDEEWALLKDPTINDHAMGPAIYASCGHLSYRGHAEICIDADCDNRAFIAPDRINLTVRAFDAEGLLKR